MPGALHTRYEKAFLIALISGALAISLGFVAATVFGGYGFPATVVAVLFGIAIAALVFAFLGGTADASFQVGAARLGGTSALILIVVWFIKGPMYEELKDAAAINAGRNAAEKLASANERADAEREAKEQALSQLRTARSNCSETQAETVAGILTRIEESSATDRLGQGVLKLRDRGKGPFNPVLSTTKLAVRFVSSVEKGTFRACYGKQPDLRDKPVTFEIIDAEAGTSRKITLKPGSDIGVGLCSAISFDVQLGCDAALDLVPDAALRCDERTGVAWKEPAANRSYEVVATLLNPDFTPGYCARQ